MTIRECNDAVVELAGNDLLFDTAPFLEALRRGIYTVSRVIPIIKEATIEHFPASAVGETVYDMTDVVTDFSSLVPQTSGKTAYRVTEGKKIHIGNAHSGAYTVRYRPSVPAYTWDDADTEIPLPDEGASLLPLGVAADILFDVEPEKAEVWQTGFRLGLQELTRVRDAGSYAEITDLYGW